jgi:hypothetical protein
MHASSPQAVAAMIAGAVELLTALATGFITFFVAERKLRRDFGLENAAEKVAHDLMTTRWRLRSFALIKAHLGGFDDDELRKLLTSTFGLTIRRG